jgi:hypothetical protein
MMQEVQDLGGCGFNMHMTGMLFTATVLIRMRIRIRISSGLPTK